MRNEVNGLKIMENNFFIHNFLELSGYTTDIRLERRTKGKNTQEFFTPYSIVKRMADKIPESDWADPTKTFLEPCFGNGQFVCYIIWNRIQHGIDWKTALQTLYGVELMPDNVKETHERIIDLLTQLNIDFDPHEAYKIMRKNLVCSDFFKWDFENWKRIPEKPKQLSLF